MVETGWFKGARRDDFGCEPKDINTYVRKTGPGTPYVEFKARDIEVVLEALNRLKGDQAIGNPVRQNSPAAHLPIGVV